MGKPQEIRGNEIPTADTAQTGESGFHSEVRALAYMPSTERRTEQKTKASDGADEKQFADDFRRSQREYMKVESGRNPQTGEPDGKPMASSETLLRAEANQVYAALHGHNGELKSAAADRLKDQKYDPNSKESVYQAYLAAERASEHTGPNATPTQIENARIHNAYIADKKHGTAIDFN